jgi:hypothetical protein
LSTRREKKKKNEGEEEQEKVFILKKKKINLMWKLHIRVYGFGCGEFGVSVAFFISLS